jgi:hypothetical protein
MLVLTPNLYSKEIKLTDFLSNFNVVKVRYLKCVCPLTNVRGTFHLINEKYAFMCLCESTARQEAASSDNITAPRFTIYIWT